MCIITKLIAHGHIILYKSRCVFVSIILQNGWTISMNQEIFKLTQRVMGDPEKFGSACISIKSKIGQ